MFEFLHSLFSSASIAIAGIFLTMGGVSPLPAPASNETLIGTSSAVNMPVQNSIPASDIPMVQSTKVSGQDSTAKALVLGRENVTSIYKTEIAKLDTRIKVNKVFRDLNSSEIDDINSLITESKGFKIGNPDAGHTVDYMVDVYTTQIKFETKFLAFLNTLIKWEEDTKAYLENEVQTIQTSSQNDLSIKVEKLNLILDNINEAETKVDPWVTQSREIEDTISGIIAGLKSSNQAPKPVITIPVTPDAYIPPPVKTITQPVTCRSTHILGSNWSYETICN
jgi:hypothetical protein